MFFNRKQLKRWKATLWATPFYPLLLCFFFIRTGCKVVLFVDSRGWWFQKNHFFTLLAVTLFIHCSMQTATSLAVLVWLWSLNNWFIIIHFCFVFQSHQFVYIGIYGFAGSIGAQWFIPFFGSKWCNEPCYVL